MRFNVKSGPLLTTNSKIKTVSNISVAKYLKILLSFFSFNPSFLHTEFMFCSRDGKPMFDILNIICVCLYPKEKDVKRKISHNI